MLRRCAVRRAGALGRENVGMSNRKCRESRHRRKPKVSSAMTIIGGLGVPKRNPAFELGIAMVSRLIFRPHTDVDGMTGNIRSSTLLDLMSVLLAWLSGKSGSGRKARAKVWKSCFDRKFDRRVSQEKSLRLLSVCTYRKPTQVGK